MQFTEQEENCFKERQSGVESISDWCHVIIVTMEDPHERLFYLDLTLSLMCLNITLSPERTWSLLINATGEFPQDLESLKNVWPIFQSWKTQN